MISLSQIKILPYSAEKIYQLIMDIESYPDFLPWCHKGKIVQVISDEILEADLLIHFRSFFEKYRSKVNHGKNIENGHDFYFINSTAIDGPFKKLVNKWKITQLENGGCRVEFFIEFEFSSKILTIAVSPLFKKAAEKMSEAFEERAERILSIR
jgi:coenzyme Q-binding protein COQ10